MKASRPTSILIFLGTCLGFAESLAGFAGKLDNRVSGVWVLLFGTLNLIIVLLALLYMFRRNPQFLIAERTELAILGLLEAIRAQTDPGLAWELIKKLDLHSISKAAGAELPSIRSDESHPDPSERRKLEEQQAKLKSGRSK